jgi:sulfide:quinone oxidoreductase
MAQGANEPTRSSSHRRPRVVIAGGGVAAIEGLIALRQLLDGFLSVDLVAPEAEFVYRPLSVAEPFALAEPRVFSLQGIAADHSARLHGGSLDAVDAEAAIASVRDGPSLGFDALFVAIGARSHQWLEGAVHFTGPADVESLRGVLAELDAGTIGSIAFTAPAGSTWTLPLYELALLTAAHVAERGCADTRLAIVTPEPDALAIFGPAAAQHVRDLCANRGIALRAGAQVRSFENGLLELDVGGDVEADRVIALPKLEGIRVPGLPSDDDGFIPVDEHCAVIGLANVYAAGDGIAYPIKQGGLAAQQADIAAQAIAARLGAVIEPKPFEPRLRGQLLTGLAPTYLTAGAVEGGPKESTVAVNPLWWPPSKIAGRYLAPYLAGHASYGPAGELEERPPIAAAAASGGDAGHDEARRLALALAERDASDGDYRSALGWLDTVEQLDGLLAPEVAGKQADWRERAR